VTALNRFISRSAERRLPFFKALKGKGVIEWGPEQSKVFAELKDYIEKMAILSPPSPSKPLLLYVAASKAAVSAALVREVETEKDKLQCPVYFVSEALSGSKLLYSELEKIAYAVIMATRKLRHYFEAHKVTMLTNQPLNDLFINKEASSRIAKWATELSEYIIEWTSLGRFPQPKATSSSQWSQLNTSPSGLRRDPSLPSPQPPSENSSGSKSYVDLECPKSSPLIMGSNSTARILGSTADQLEQSFASRLCTTLSPTTR
jgi:hypothetical protein